MIDKLTTMDAYTLITTPMAPIRHTVQELIPQGVHLLAGTVKIGKAGWHYGSACR